MPWTDDYIGLPFCCDGRSRAGLDCGGLVILVYREQLGIEIPAHLGALVDLSPFGLRKASAEIKAELAKWVPVAKEDIRPFDVLSFRRGSIESCHVGIACSRTHMLHITRGIDACMEPFTGPQWRHKLSGAFRYDR